MKIITDSSIEIKCPSCLKETTIEEWDKNTIAQCNTRKQRRDYISIQDKKSKNRHDEVYYYCGGCNRWIIGYVLHNNIII